MKPVSLRLKAEHLAAVDEVARAAGLNRSEWITRAILDSLTSRREELRDLPAPTGRTSALFLRLDHAEIAAIDAAAAAVGATRMQWLRRTIRWQLWSRAGELRLAPFTARAITKLTFQVRAIGRLLNDSVRAMQTANLRESTSELVSASRHVVDMEERLTPVIMTAARETQRLISGEVAYWTRRSEEPE
ncbi:MULTISPECIES: ribbon-helix-helix protein, CopG family [unclassified Novosphingobium]|uniref:ribbon-helix-helix protein, CopG family n=1 Tax=unclassified Novosphingobium TaxID=2644732 RepID=UPI00146C1BD6|nr:MULTISPECIES: ribbon-helix-helix protein, CopG family [unclassified Novosphingobium]NMN07536.1 uncharacterized protein (DUF1778 family) [Novosphingobium sp. SG919]NMN89861.1 uncharacterized protein (DUF1778 family) [Novosphingobium sp. SG916]